MTEAEVDDLAVLRSYPRTPLAVGREHTFGLMDSVSVVGSVQNLLSAAVLCVLRDDVTPLDAVGTVNSATLTATQPLKPTKAFLTSAPTLTTTVGTASVHLHDANAALSRKRKATNQPPLLLTTAACPLLYRTRSRDF